MKLGPTIPLVQKFKTFWEYMEEILFVAIIVMDFTYENFMVFFKFSLA